jgi:plastocyanin
MEVEEESTVPGLTVLLSLSIIGILVGVGIAAYLAVPLQPPLPLPGGITTTANGSATLITMPGNVGSSTNLNFAPASVTVFIGVNNTLEWLNADSALHTVTSSKVPDGATAFDSGTMASGARYDVTLTVPGTYLYFCKFHDWMQATVVVKAFSGVLVNMPQGLGSSTNLNFAPAQVTVVVGVNNTISWLDNDTSATAHTVTSSSVPTGAASFDSGSMSAGQRFTLTLTVPGTYKYGCTFHNWMLGTIIVKSA